MGSKKRRRSDSFQADDDDARKRLAAFHAKMFELPQEDAVVMNPETPRVLFKSKNKKHKKKSGEVDDGEPVPMVKFNKKKPKKEKKNTNVAAVVAEKKVTGPAVVKVPGMVSNTPQEKKVKKEKKIKKVKGTDVKKTMIQAHQWQMEVKRDDSDGEDPLEQALSSMKDIVTKKVAKPLRKKNKTVAGDAVAVLKEVRPKKNIQGEEKTDALTKAVDSDAGGGTTEHISKSQKKSMKKKQKPKRAREANNSQPTAQNSKKSTGEVKNAQTAVSEKVNGAESTAEQIKNEAAPSKIPAPFKKAMNVKKGKNASKPAVPIKKVVPDEEKKAAKSLTPIAVSLAKDAKKKNDMFLPARETPRGAPLAPKRVKKTVPSPVAQLIDESSSSESEDDGRCNFDHRDGDDSLFSRLIDSAARERWELIEVGRLVRLFAAEWGFKESKTARFLCDTCPELVSVDFLEGLGVNMPAKQLVQVFEAGSGNSEVLMNKMASAVENGHLSVRDPSFVSALERRVALMESNGEVMEFLHPLLESLSTVRDVGCLLKQLCEHWQVERKLALVQQVLLSNVFDDLDGNQDDILLDLPDLTGRLDFPSRLDQEDVDENGNLKGFLANEDSEYSGEEGSEEDEEVEDDSENDEDPYEGETDSDEEVEITSRSRGRNYFIEDEADVGEEEEEEEERLDDNGSSSSSDSD